MNEPLENIRHETFCQLYAGKCFGYAGRAYRQAGFRCKTNAVAMELGSKLLRNLEVWTRIKYLREQIRQTMAIDAAKILKLRLDIAENRKGRSSDKISALKDIERSLGLELPARLEHSGGIRVDLSTLSSDQLKALVDIVETDVA
jgi:hypothetical protein